MAEINVNKGTLSAKYNCGSRMGSARQCSVLLWLSLNTQESGWKTGRCALCNIYHYLAAQRMQSRHFGL